MAINFNVLNRLLPNPEATGLALASLVGVQQTLAVVGVDGYISNPEQALVPLAAVGTAFCTGYFFKKAMPHFEVAKEKWTNAMKDDVVHLLGSAVVLLSLEMCSLIVLNTHVHHAL